MISVGNYGRSIESTQYYYAATTKCQSNFWSPTIIEVTSVLIITVVPVERTTHPNKLIVYVLSLEKAKDCCLLYV